MKKVILGIVAIVVVIVAVRYIGFSKKNDTKQDEKGNITIICDSDVASKGSVAEKIINEFERETEKKKIGLSTILVDNKGDMQFEEVVEGTIKSGVKFIVVIGEKNRAQITLLSEKYPGVQFEVIGGNVEGVSVSSHTYKDEEAGFLAGYLAAKKSKTKRIGFIGIEDKEYVNKYKYGYVAGANYADEKVKVKTKYLKNNKDKNSAYKTAEELFNDNNVDVIFEKVGNVKGNVIKAASDYKKKVITSDLVDFDSIESQYKYSILSSTTRESKSIVSNIVQKYQDKEVESNTSEYGLVEGGVNLEDIDDKLDRELKEEIEDVKRKIELKEIEVPDSSTSLETFLNTKDKE